MNEKCHEQPQQEKFPFGFLPAPFQIRSVMEPSLSSFLPSLIQSFSEGTEEGLFPKDYTVMDNSVVIVWGGGLRGISGYGKKYNKNK